MKYESKNQVRVKRCLIVRLYVCAILAISPLGLASVASASGTCVAKLSEGGKVISRRSVRVQTGRLLVQTVRQARGMKGDELESELAKFTKTMLDKGHISWRKSYQSGLAKEGKDLATPRFKPVPKGPKTDELLQYIASLSGAAQESFMTTNGYRFVQNGDRQQLEQNINQDPDQLFPALHVKLNGVHEKYANIVAQFVSVNVKSGVKIKKSDLTALSSAIHDIWMQDASWKVQPVLEKFGITQDQFYSLPISKIVEISEGIIGTGDFSKLTPDDVAALNQFTAYQNLDSQNKLLDDQILLDHVTTLHGIIVSSDTGAANSAVRSQAASPQRNDLPATTMPLPPVRDVNSAINEVVSEVASTCGENAAQIKGALLTNLAKANIEL